MHRVVAAGRNPHLGVLHHLERTAVPPPGLERIGVLPEAGDLGAYLQHLLVDRQLSSGVDLETGSFVGWGRWWRRMAWCRAHVPPVGGHALSLFFSPSLSLSSCLGIGLPPAWPSPPPVGLPCNQASRCSVASQPPSLPPPLSACLVIRPLVVAPSRHSIMADTREVHQCHHHTLACTAN